jgi:hypothetical protein
MAKRSTKEGNRKTREYQVFLSHATADKWLAKTLCEKIEETGATTFRDDRDIAGGDDIPDEIRKNISQSRELLVLLSPESVDRPWVLLEVGAAWGRKISRIVAILCHVRIDAIPSMLSSKKAIPLNEFDQYIAELSKRVKGS